MRNVISEQTTGEVSVDVSRWTRVPSNTNGGIGQTRVKRMTAPGLDSKDSGAATWAGQSYENGTASGTEVIEALSQNGTVIVKRSEGVLVFF